MESILLEAYIHEASKIFVWVQLSEQRGCYLKTSKSALLEYLADPDNVFDENIFFEYGENKEIYIGRPYSDE